MYFLHKRIWFDLVASQLYACHAAAIVHHRMGWTHHEVGKVDVGRMATILRTARDCGFSVPLAPQLAAGSADGVQVHGAPQPNKVWCDLRRFEGTGGGTRAGGAGSNGDFGDGEEQQRWSCLPRPDGVVAVASRGPRDSSSSNSSSRSCSGHAGDDHPPQPQPLKWGEQGARDGSTGDAGAGPGGRDAAAFQDQGGAQQKQQYCRVMVVGAGASGLSAAACLRARGEDGVVILER